MKKFIGHASLAMLLAIFSLNSCVPLKDYVYLQGDESLQNVAIADPSVYRIQPNDNLYIQVISNDELSAYFNLSSTDRYLNNDAAIELGSYKVDPNGEIDFPFVGNIKVAGLTPQEIKALISKGISERLLQYSVIVKHVNRTVSLLGEFNRPGTVSIYKDHLNIFEAIGMGGDLTDFANRHKVKVFRNINGEKVIETLDLTHTDLLKSEYFYILPNDVIYVAPTSRVYGAKTLPVATLLSTVNAAFNIYYFFNAVLNTK